MRQHILVSAICLSVLAPSSFADAQVYGSYSDQVYISPAPVVIVPTYSTTPVVLEQKQTQQTQQRTPHVHLQQSPSIPSIPPHPYVRRSALGLGLRANVVRTGEREFTFFGGGGVLRIMPRSRMALELTVDGNGSEDGVSVPIGLSGLVFFNIRRHIQPYILGGFTFTATRPRDHEMTFLYTGGQLGLGVEFMIGRRLGLTLDGRTFVQGKVRDIEDVIEYGITFNMGFNLYLSKHNRRYR